MDNCACNLDSCEESWEPGCGLGRSESHAREYRSLMDILYRGNEAGVCQVYRLDPIAGQSPFEHHMLLIAKNQKRTLIKTDLVSRWIAVSLNNWS